AKVLPNGCALVGDCRKPRPGEQVDANGCAIDKNFILKGVKFEFDSDRLTKEAQRILDQVATTLGAYPNVNVEVEGHTDSIGSDSYNLGLSERRAIAVKKYLADHAVSAKRMTPVGYGETRPIDSNETETGRENNRRVELHVVE
ncbi:MAG: OmpA family protein, partial [Solimonas sp.]